MLPGNELHRDQALNSLTKAYAHAATYCDRRPDSCRRLLAALDGVRIVFAQEASRLDAIDSRSRQGAHAAPVQ